ncbi:MAG: carboxypeptidase regulatory-like domain-containing protein [Acidobacteria bacterium ACB1]|nr:hypothetical protein [Pyrinomonadaceae bacterium]MCE7962086.1 carboxypeptidase regulatory-like domain-containing protein [Acidobacteria bacterium ACB1]RIJ95433.1 MAG: hypothetical protein DCC44_02285 [Acidobacteriota bacterium]
MRSTEFQLKLLTISCLVIIVAFSFVDVNGQSDRYSISGRVVDSIGRPVPNPEVYFYREDGLPNPATPAASSDFGSFTYDQLSKATKAYIWRMYVGYPPCGNGARVLMPPFAWLGSVDDRFAGAVVPLGVADDIKLGDVKVQYRYSSATLDLSELKDGKNDVDWGNVYLQVRTEKGKRIDLSSFSPWQIQTFVNRARSTIEIEIPEGNWSFDIVFLNNEKDPTAELAVASSPVVEIKDGQARPVVHFQRLKTPIQQYDGLRRDAR